MAGLSGLQEGLPFNFCEKKSTRRYITLQTLGRQSWTEYITKMVKIAELEIQRKLPDKIGLLIDGWSDTSSSTNYLGERV